MQKTTIIAGGGLVMNEAGELLMIYRRGKWDLPKGKLDAGETIEECAVREVMEETGVSGIELHQLVAVGYHEYFDTYINKEVIKETHWFAMSVKGAPTLIPQTEEDITSIKWVSGQALQDCLADSYANVVEVVNKYFNR